MDIVLSLSMKMNEFTALKSKLVLMGGDEEEIISAMEDITRYAVSGSLYKDRYYRQWGLACIPNYMDQSHSTESLNAWAHSWHDLINKNILINDEITCKYLDRIIMGGLF